MLRVISPAIFLRAGCGRCEGAARSFHNSNAKPRLRRLGNHWRLTKSFLYLTPWSLSVFQSGSDHGAKSVPLGIMILSLNNRPHATSEPKPMLRTTTTTLIIALITTYQISAVQPRLSAILHLPFQSPLKERQKMLLK